ncbi:carboxymuconolactone decarboxylase family protein [Mycobacterium sp. ITM-2016-00318]|uniref:carboxymuconolactone decarboxylase family protein n=1 Tax=Mycobacterium sp. ITM-2016-00318 TaxID=2099693 RepID=UPI000CF86DEF|nr:carboxymuconolactone decarboxylase family protein [Mycobacterium sp. ITM-2016-00318]WNG93404.1 carboxymuconolactone decarboxylase family protein [Mycobacterium sp. ITM-2016-00318]
MNVPARIEPGGFRELGPVNWAIAKLGARAIRAPRFSLVTVLGQHKLLFLAWAPYSAMLLGMLSKLPVRDAEVVILRVGHLRDCEYELQQHRRLARTRGLGPELQAKIFEGPDADGLTDRQRALITATDEFVVTRGVSPETWATLASHLNKSQLIEFCMLAAQYDGLAATITTLNVPLDFPD